MTDDELRQAAARALGWTLRDSKIQGRWYVLPGGVRKHPSSHPPLDWTTAGALLEVCALQGAYVFIDCVDGDIDYSAAPARGTKRFREVTARTVIEACVMALGGGE